MARFRRNLALGFLAAGLACSPGIDLDEVPVGAAVQLTREDGGLVEGRLLDRTDEQVTIDAGLATREVPRADITSLHVVEAGEPMPPPPPSATYRHIVVPSGTDLQIDLGTAVDTATSKAGDEVEATLARHVMVDETIVLPQGSRVTGRVESVQPAGKVKGRARLALVFTSITAGEENYPVSTRFEMVAPATRAEDARTIGIPAAGGAVVGAVIGGGKGAAIGAAIGGGAGTARVLTTAGDEVRLAEGTTLRVTLEEPLDVKVPIIK